MLMVPSSSGDEKGMLLLRQIELKHKSPQHLNYRWDPYESFLKTTDQSVSDLNKKGLPRGDFLIKSGIVGEVISKPKHFIADLGSEVQKIFLEKKFFPQCQQILGTYLGQIIPPLIGTPRPNFHFSRRATVTYLTSEL